METFYRSASEKAWVPKVDSEWGGWGSGVTDIAMTNVNSTETKIWVVLLKGKFLETLIYQLRCAWGTGLRGTNQSRGYWTVHTVVIGWIEHEKCYVPGHLALFFLYFSTFLFFSWPLCTYRVTWPSLLAGNPIVPLVWTSLLFSSLGRSVTPIVHDAIVLWPPLFMMPIVLSFCMLSQVAALMYISWAYFLELGLKPDLVCKFTAFKVLVAWTSHFPFLFLWVHLQSLEDAPHSSLSSPRHWSYVKVHWTLRRDVRKWGAMRQR